MGGRQCPLCGSSSLRRSRRKTLIEKILLPLFGRLPYRCEQCDHRFYAAAGPNGNTPPAKNDPPLAA